MSMPSGRLRNLAEDRESRIDVQPWWNTWAQESGAICYVRGQGQDWEQGMGRWLDLKDQPVHPIFLLSLEAGASLAIGLP